MSILSVDFDNLAHNCWSYRFLLNNVNELLRPFHYLRRRKKKPIDWGLKYHKFDYVFLFDQKKPAIFHLKLPDSDLSIKVSVPYIMNILIYNNGWRFSTRSERKSIMSSRHWKAGVRASSNVDGRDALFLALKKFSTQFFGVDKSVADSVRGRVFVLVGFGVDQIGSILLWIKQTKRLNF